MLTLNDGRSELWQWDTGRTLAVDADCSQVHFSNKVFGRSIDVDVTDGVAIIPDILLQTDNDLNVWAFVGTAENGYTKISKTFKVNRRNKPADYVFTPTDQMTLQTIQSQIGDLADLTTEAKDTLVAAINEAARTGGGSTVKLDTTLTQSGKAADAAAVGDAINLLSEEIANLPSGGSGLTAAQISALDGMFKVTAFSADPVAAYDAFKAAFGIEGSESESVPATAIVLDKTTLSFADATTQTISATVTPANSTDPVVWSTSDPSVATVSGGVVTPVADGSCTITATAGSVFASCEVTVAISSEQPDSGVEWEIGGINPQGTLNTNAARLRTAGLIPREYDSVSANDGYELIVCCYAEDGTNATGSVYFNPNGNTVGSLGVYSSGPIDLAGIKAGTIGFTSTYSWFRILLRRTDGANMSVEEGANAVVFA